tara:strand:+ start:600 stop:980 length:381 start_codon:yes stop_codon:yes gene_type:complete
MKNMSKLSFAIIMPAFLLFSASGAIAGDAGYETKGIGDYSCKDYESASLVRPSRQTDDVNKTLRDWAYGFASAMNVEKASNNQKGKSLKFLTGDLVVQEVDAYCKKNPDKGLLAAILSTYKSLPAN